MEEDGVNELIEWTHECMNSLSLHPGNEVPSQGPEIYQGSSGSTHAWKSPGDQSGGRIQGQFIVSLVFFNNSFFITFDYVGLKHQFS